MMVEENQYAITRRWSFKINTDADRVYKSTSTPLHCYDALCLYLVTMDQTVG